MDATITSFGVNFLRLHSFLLNTQKDSPGKKKKKEVLDYSNNE